MDNVIKHYNHNHGKDGRFTFGSKTISSFTKNNKTFYKIPYKMINTTKNIIDLKIPFTNTHININKTYKDMNYLNLRADLIRESKLRIGDRVYRYSSKHEKLKTAPTYILNNEHDVKKYKDYIDQLDGNKESKYLHTMIIKKEVNLPSYIKQVDVFKNMMKDARYQVLYKNAFKNSFFYNKKTNNTKKIMDSINNKSDKTIANTYREFSNIILSPKHRMNQTTRLLHNEYVKRIKEQGYDGIIDTNDAGKFSESPIYLFNAKKHLSDNITIENINRQKEIQEVEKLHKLGFNI